MSQLTKFVKMFRFRPKVKSRAAVAHRPGRVEPKRCSLVDTIRGGWFNDDTGELFTGFPIRPDDTFLDVGCGDGGATMFAARQKCAIIATDILADKLETLAKKLQASPARSYQCLVSDSNPLPLPDQSVTRVICSEVMEHVPDPALFIRELVRVGQPNALYMLTVPDPVAEHLQMELAPPAYWRPPNHVRIFSREDFPKLVTDAGLVIESKHFVGFYWSIWWMLFWASGQEFGAPEAPLLAAWTNTWAELLSNPKGDRIKKILDNFMPKSQIIIARKPA